MRIESCVESTEHIDLYALLDAELEDIEKGRFIPAKDAMLQIRKRREES